jgi:nicotinamidase-related amidase
MKAKTNARPAAKHQKDIALLVIDVQQGLFAKSIPIYQADELLKNIGTLVDRAHRAGAPVFYVQHSSEKILPEGSGEWQLHPRLRPLKKDRIIHKQHGSAFQDTPLGEVLEANCIRRLVVMGLVTHGCVRATCVDASKRGYQVILASDGHSNFHKQAARVIAEWNQKLSEGIVQLKLTQEIDFG